MSLNDNALQKMKIAFKLAYDFDQKQNAIKNENIPDKEKAQKSDALVKVKDL